MGLIYYLLEEIAIFLRLWNSELLSIHCPAHKFSGREKLSFVPHFVSTGEGRKQN